MNDIPPSSTVGGWYLMVCARALCATNWDDIRRRDIN